MSGQPERMRINTYIAKTTAELVDERAQEWGVTKGEAMDRLIRRAVGLENAERQTSAGLDAMEEMVRRVLGDFTLQTTNTLQALLDERLERPHLEVSCARLLLFALIAHLKSPEVAIKNEDEALRVARRGRETGEIPLLLRGTRSASGASGKKGQ